MKTLEYAYEQKKLLVDFLDKQKDPRLEKLRVSVVKTFSGISQSCIDVMNKEKESLYSEEICHIANIYLKNEINKVVGWTKLIVNDTDRDLICGTFNPLESILEK